MSLKEKSQSSQIAGDNANQYQAETIVVNNYNYDNHQNRSCALKKLIDEYHQERSAGGNTSLTKLIDKLNHYDTVIDNQFIGLENKLCNGGFDNDVTWALQLKQNYYKELQKTKFFPTAQKIHAFILARVYTLFNQYVYDAIKAGAPKEVIRQLIIGKVLVPIEELVNSEENVLELYIDDINAMIYFLTGNCHLKWN
jgi:hypothetical protein